MGSEYFERLTGNSDATRLGKVADYPMMIGVRSQ